LGKIVRLHVPPESDWPVQSAFYTWPSWNEGKTRKDILKHALFLEDTPCGGTPY
jgi:hypothetical protein